MHLDPPHNPLEIENFHHHLIRRLLHIFMCEGRHCQIIPNSYLIRLQFHPQLARQFSYPAPNHCPCLHRHRPKDIPHTPGYSSFLLLPSVLLPRLPHLVHLHLIIALAFIPFPKIFGYLNIPHICLIFPVCCYLAYLTWCTVTSTPDSEAAGR